jgi:hypothetical protein
MPIALICPPQNEPLDSIHWYEYLYNLGKAITELGLPIAVPNGGTGDGSLNAHGVLIGEGKLPVNVTSPGVAGQVFQSNGPSADPSFSAPVTVSNGGTGDTSLTNHGVLVGNGASAIAVTTPGLNFQFLSGVSGNDPVFRVLATPDGPGLTLGGTFPIPKLTPGGTNGSLTIQGGWITAAVAPT